jgi:hypothetical protein
MPRKAKKKQKGGFMVAPQFSTMPVPKRRQWMTQKPVLAGRGILDTIRNVIAPKSGLQNAFDSIKSNYATYKKVRKQFGGGMKKISRGTVSLKQSSAKSINC